MNDKIYFLSGLGSNSLFLKDLDNCLNNLDIKQIDLPGHGINYNVILKNLVDLEEWFLKNIKINNSNNITVIGHSLGADLLVYLGSKIPFIKNIILLDGGLFNLSDFSYSLNSEVEETMQFIENNKFSNLKEYIEKEKEDYLIWNDNIKQASIGKMIYNLEQKVYEIGINTDSIKTLLEIRRMINLPDFNSLRKKNILVLLPENQDEGLLKFKLKKIPSFVEYEIISASGHDIYIENPKKVGETINEWVSKQY